MEATRGSRDPQPPRKSARLMNRKQRKRDEEKRKAEEERKRARTRFRRKSNVIPPNDLLVDTGKIHLGPDDVSEDVKVKVEPHRIDSEVALESSGSTEEQGHQVVIVMPPVIIKTEEAEGMEEDGAPTSANEKQKNGTLVDNPDEVEGNALIQQHDNIHDEIEDGPSSSGLQMPLVASNTENPPLSAVFGHLNDDLKERLKEKDQKIAQLTAELAVVKKREKAKIKELQEIIADLQLQLSSTKDIPEATGAKEGLSSSNNQLKGQFLAQNYLDLQGNSDQDDSEDMEMMSPESNDNCGTAGEHPDVFESFPKSKNNERIEAPLFEAVLNILVERKRTIAGKINWKSVCGLMKKCRLVCQSWKASVDSVLQTHPSHLELFKPFDFGTIDKENSSPCPLNLSFVVQPLGVPLSLDIAPSKMGQFIMNLPAAKADSNYNPVPTRHLSVRVPLHIKSGQVTGNVFHLRDYLRVFGHEIWYLRLSWGHNIQARGMDFDDVCRNLSEILHLVPNLRLLSLNVYFEGWMAKRNHLTESEMGYQFPRLKHLVVLECLHENPVIIQILEANSHVRSLAVHQSSTYSFLTAFFVLDLPNLSELFVSYQDWIETEIFRKGKVTWKIRKLQLQHGFPRCAKMLSFYSMNDGLAVYGDSLEDLKLDFEFLDFSREGAQFKLPRLKSLSLYTNNWDEFKCGIFLAKLELLETLEIVVDVRDLAMISTFHEEPHWLTMPQLRTVTLVARMYLEYPHVLKEKRTVFKLKRVGMKTVKFIYVRI